MAAGGGAGGAPMSELQALHRLAVGHEVDYRPCPHTDYWLPARVEAIWDHGASLRLRFTVGVAHVTHDVDLRRAEHLARVAPLGA
jgi:hypothetical protein